MPNERLRGAMAARGLTVARSAELVGVDVKTVERWITRDRVPHRPHRHATAKLLGVEETYLWPSLTADQHTVSAGRAELVEFYPSRSSVPPQLWRSLVDQANECLDVLVFAGLFLPEIQDIGRLGERARHGCRVRLLLGDPHATAVAVRGEEEGFGNGVAHRILLTLKYYQAILAVPGVELRLHNTTLYASIFRSDDTMLVNTHVYGSPAAHNPVLHLRRIPGGRVVEHYLTSFDKVWANATPTTDVERLITAFNQER
ncbi:XRE family transcriptional regulator [Dactylosporangium sp. NPDC051485]|uniref:helix-turn-helix domain-containing protein n=1 Tax=Dactylosporangium sp. NPDC051485 TaxID=3154846 RepID=UPI00341C85F3